MSDVRPNDRPRITLEQLLALKRSERPDPAFWEGFDRELHRRQLASVVVRPAWYVRAARGMVVGLRRAAPVAAAGAAAVAGFLVWQHPSQSSQTATETAPADKPVAVAVAVPEHPSPVSAIPVSPLPESSAPVAAYERPVTGETRFVVHEFVAAATPTRTFVSVSSPNSFSSPAYDASLQMVNALTAGSYNAAGVSTDAGRF